MKFIENIQKAYTAVASFLSTQAQALKALFSYGYSFLGRKEPKAPADSHAGGNRATTPAQKTKKPVKGILFSKSNSRRAAACQERKRRQK